jgi:hypothetical protein
MANLGAFLEKFLYSSNMVLCWDWDNNRPRNEDWFQKNRKSDQTKKKIITLPDIQCLELGIYLIRIKIRISGGKINL